MRRLLEGVVPGELLLHYLSLLARGRLSVEEAPGLLDGAGNIDALIREGMAYCHGDDHSMLVAASPDLVLQRALARMAGHLAAEHQRLLDGQERLRAIQAPTDATAGGAMDQLVQILTDGGKIAELTLTLAGSAQRDWLILGARMAADASDATSTSANCRALYESRCVASAGERESVEAVIRAGGMVRLAPRVGMSMRLADEAIALLPLSERNPSGALLIQSSVIVGALREYFELLWERATPYGVPDVEEGPLPPIQMKILRLLVQGLSDTVVAERVGVSVTTVGRHVTAIREALGVQHRFALGVVAVQQGLVE
ncbi:helix-turn-helix transcriptional regulator [Actinomadura macra]|uniref:helix-turn-helix transcriptional regulator n=1 Tax=Actinomadura macra TaxID=46164 RepID=UPI001471F528|nr:helix-turn-helix transcriptional regulator [Actinomadura macra]